MNIFVLENTPELSAQSQCDAHIGGGKMYLEAAQILCSVWYFSSNGPLSVPYKLTHKNHPCSIWARQSPENYEWCLRHTIALGEEYSFRSGKIHASKRAVDYCLSRFESLDFSPFAKSGLTPFALAMPDQYKTDCPILSYRNYYIGEKSKIARWGRGRGAPEWWPK